MANVSESRARVSFAVLNALVAVILLVGVFGLMHPRFWAVDCPAALLAGVELVSAVALLARLPWALRALSIAAWVTFVGGLLLVALIVLTMVFLRSVHGEDGMVATAVSGLVLALLVPYTLLLPAVQLLWLKGRVGERES
ncbi:MAG TPA: hypothetical protein VK745_33050 [Polyangiaceae bacterium]|jgi:hypothetical protein|nr:hypothetical protein [Polyangiaceae bacterium]